MFPYSRLIPYTIDSNFDDMAVDDALHQFLRVEMGINFTIRVLRTRAPVIYTTHALTPDVWATVLLLVDEAARRDDEFY